MNHPLPLEDTVDDVLKKALRFHNFTGRDLPLLKDDRARFIKNKLHLSPEALDRLPFYAPSATLPPGLKQHSFPFYDSGVNIWSLEYPEGVVLIDTGCTPKQLSGVLDELSISRQRPPLALLITHEHHDHTGGRSACPECPVFDAFTPLISVLPAMKVPVVIAGRDWRVYKLPGHTPDSVAFYTDYEGHPLLFTGDALFAGSVGNMRSPEHFGATLRNLQTALQSLPGETLLLPGHGPASTIAQEWNHNPFLRATPTPAQA